MRFIPYILAVAAFAQVTTPLKVSQGGATAGQLWLQEPRAGGTDWLKLRAGTLSGDLTFTLPAADGTSGQCMQTDGAGQWQWAACNSSAVDLITTDYDWSQTPGVSLTAATPATVTLTPCPLGVAPYIAHYSARISGGTGAAETVLISGVTGSGSTCDIDFTPANNHTGSWVIASASDGIQEAVNLAISSPGHRVFIPQGVSTVDPVAPGEESTIYVQGAVIIAGANQSINGGSEIALTHDGQWAIIVTTGATNWPVHFEKFSIQGTGLAAGGTGVAPVGGGIKITATVTASPSDAEHNQLSKIKDMQLYTLPTGVWCEKCAITEFTGNLFYGFLDYGIYYENIFDTDAGDPTITNNNFQVIGTSSAVAVNWLSAGGAKIIGNKFNLQGAAINATLGGATIITTISGNSFDNQKLYSVKLRGTSGFLGAAIVGNVVTGAGDASYIAFDIADNTTDDISNVIVADNSMQAAGTAIKIGDAANASVNGNVMGSFTTGIQVKAAATGFSHGKNTCYSVTTCHDISASAGVRPTSPLFASGYGGYASSTSNIKAIAEFAAPTSGEVNNGILLQTNTTGSTSQRGFWWDSSANFYISRFPSDRAAGQADDLKLEADGDAKFTYNVGIGRSPTSGVALDAQGVVRSTDGTTITQMYSNAGSAYIGTETNHPVRIMQDNTERLRVTNSQLLPGLVDSVISFGDPTLRMLGTYSKIFDSVAVGGTGDYMQTRKLQLFDNTGSSTGASFWDLNVVMSGVGAGQNSYFYLRDNGGNTVWRADKIASGAAVATTTIYTDLLPDSTANVRDLGKTTQRWDEINGASLDLTGAANISGNLSAAVINATGSPAYRVSGTTVINASRAATFTDLTINTSSAPTVGYVWTATSTGGAGSWQASGASKWTAGSGTDVYRSAGNVGIGTSTPQGLIDLFSASNIGTSPLISMRSDFAAAGRFGGIRFGDQSQTSLYQKGAIYYESVATSARGKIHIALEATDTSASVGLSDARLTVTQSGIEVPGAASIGGTLTATGLTVNTGAATVGYCWIATSTGGAGSWQTCARLNATQTFVNPQTIAIASVQNQLTLSQTNNTGAYDPACLVLASTDTVGATVYGAARLCAGYESASFTNEKFSIQTATGSGTYQDVLTAKNQVVTFAGDIVATVGSFSFTSGTMAGTMKPLFNSTGKIGDTSYYYDNGYFTTANIGTVEAATAYKMGGTTVINSSRNVVGVNAFAQSITFSAGSTYNVGSVGAPPLNIWGNYITPVTELTMGSGVVFRGSLIPATNNTDAIGNTSFRVSNVATVNANISGTITAPSGSSGITSTKTVRDSAGTGTCTLIFSGGILTGGTC